MYPKWYFEVVVDSVETVTHQQAKIRIGWANTEGYDAQPGGGAGWGATSLGDDLFSYAFDGDLLWTGGKAKHATIGTDVTPLTGTQEEPREPQTLKHGDVVGCLLDLMGPVIQFNVNGRLVRGYFQVSGFVSFKAPQCFVTEIMFDIFSVHLHTRYFTAILIT